MLTQVLPVPSPHLVALSTSETPPPSMNDFALKALADQWVDGVLILNSTGEWIYANPLAHQLCAQLSQNRIAPKQTPAEIWHYCRDLISGYHDSLRQMVIFETSISQRDRAILLRIRVQWLESNANEPYILVILEDRHRALQKLVRLDQVKYQLTQRETEVWFLRRAGLTYQEIAGQCHITLNTVKVYLKRVYAKQKVLLDQEAY